MSPSPRRNTELGLMLLAMVLTAGAYVLASLGRSSTLPANVVPFLFVVVGLLGAAHVATRRLAPDADVMLLPLASLLNGIGYVFIARLDSDLAGLQALWTAIGVGAYVATLALVRRSRDIERFRYTFALIGIGLLLMPLLPVIGRNINGSRLWVRFAGITFQPGEMAKIALCIFFASYLVEKRELLSTTTNRIGPIGIPDLRHFGPIVLAWGFSLVVLLAERDLGSSLLFFALFISMLWVATGRGIYLLIGGGLFGVGTLIAWQTFAHVQQRMQVWKNPWPVADGTGFQIVQALFAFAAGGMWGMGISLGNPQRIPAVTTDFIVAAIGEELGLVGTAAIVITFLLIIGAGLRVAVRAHSPFDKLLAAGLTTIFGLQSFIIIGGVVRAVPLTGITLPFVSYGGSSLVANYILLALLLRISDGQGGERHAGQAGIATPSGGGVNAQIRRLGTVLVGLMLALMAWLSYWQIFAAKRLNADPRNTRKIVRDFSRPRGVIQTADGAVLARSVPTDDEFERLRTYPEGSLFGQVTGFFSFSYGADGAERQYNDYLTGNTAALRLQRLEDVVLGKRRTANVTLTLTKRAQQAAATALGSRKGSVVALDPRTGAVLALWSFPSFDPTPLASHDLRSVREVWDSLNANPAKPLLARSFKDRYPPGSTFKVVTASAALANGATLDQPTFPVLRELPLPNTGGQTLRNFGGKPCGGSLSSILTVSCNTAFAQLGLDVGGDKLAAAADAFGFTSRPPIDLPGAVSSTFPEGKDFARDKPGLAKSAIGQQEVAATPLEMALVAAGVANDGVIMRPHVMSEIRDSEGVEVERARPQTWTRAMPPDVAATLSDLMVSVVQRGTATRASLPGVQVAAKTGTAQTGRDTSHAWIIAFAPAETPQVAVAVIVEDQRNSEDATGGAIAAPIAKAVMQSVLGGP